MSEALFEYLANRDLAQRDPRDIARRLTGQSRSQLETLIDELEALIPPQQEHFSTPFEFLANTTYSGGRSPCTSFTCRADRTRELAYFTALYADRVWYPSPFAGLKSAPNDNDLRLELVFYIHRLLRMRPLFDAGFMVLTASSRAGMCLDCYARMVGNQRTAFTRSFNKLKAELEQRYIRDVDYYVERRGSRIGIVPRGPNTLIDEHYGALVLRKPPEALKRLVGKTEKKPIRLTKAFMREHELVRPFYYRTLEDILNQNYYARRYGTGYLTNRPLDLELINKLSPEPIQRTNALLEANFSHELPVVGGAKLDDLVSLRRNEGEAFAVYRDALTAAIKESKDDDPRKMSQAFRDVVAPELHKVNAAIKRTQAVLVKDAVVDAAIATGFVGVGLFSGLLPPNIGQVVAALGGYHFFTQAKEKVKSIAFAKDSARNSAFYFLWKVSRHKRGDAGGQSM